MIEQIAEEPEIEAQKQRYLGLIGLLRFLRHFLMLRYTCEEFRSQYESNRVVGRLPYSVWRYDVARAHVHHNTWRSDSVERGGLSRNCGCKKWRQYSFKKGG